MSQYLQIFSRQSINSLLSARAGETKLGETVQLCGSEDWKLSLQKSSAKFVLLGIPEDIGVRANGGVGGAETAWLAAVKSLLNIQSTAQFSGNELLILAHFDFSEWVKASESMNLDELRNLVAKIDDEVFPVIQQIVAANKIPIVIGGGHNNAFGLLKGSSLALQQSVNCINLDAHSDYRQMEGRHSGNGFRYAKAQNYMQHYAIIGLHENYNSQNIIDDLKSDPELHFSFYEDIFLREKCTFTEAIQQAIAHTANKKTGIELDLDCIENVLSSATSPSGISVLQARQYINTCASKTNVAYLHLTEGATLLKDGRGDISTGKLIAYLVSDFVKASTL